MKQLIMLKGLPASGKTTWSKNKIKENPGKFKRLSKDDLRSMLDGGKWSRDNEKFILQTRDAIITAALAEGKHTIVDDTNLAPKHESCLRELARNNKAEFIIEDFTFVDVEECIRRDQKRPNYVGEIVIRDMYNQYLKPAPQEAPKYNPLLPDAYIIDIDGTVALMNGRGPFEWSKVGNDLPNWPVINTIKRALNWDGDINKFGPVPIFVSGRDEVCRLETKDWLQKNNLLASRLFMRPAGDSRDDRIVKEEIYRREIEGKYNVLAVFDDRDKVVDMWRNKLGLTCLQVAEGNF